HQQCHRGAMGQAMPMWAFADSTQPARRGPLSKRANRQDRKVAKALTAAMDWRKRLLASSVITLETDGQKLKRPLEWRHRSHARIPEPKGFASNSHRSEGTDRPLLLRHRLGENRPVGRPPTRPN